MPVVNALCQCGCGQPAPLASDTRPGRGYVQGQPLRYIHGHHVRGKRNPRWRNGRAKSHGYETVKTPEHARANPNGYAREHVLVAERVLGRALPPGAVVHHVNENRTDNRPANLVICQDNGYHQMLHQRLIALRACGRASWRKCKFCKEYDAPENLYTDPCSYSSHHRACRRAYRRGARQ